MAHKVMAIGHPQDPKCTQPVRPIFPIPTSNVPTTFLMSRVQVDHEMSQYEKPKFNIQPKSRWNQSVMEWLDCNLIILYYYLLRSKVVIQLSTRVTWWQAEFSKFLTFCCKYYSLQKPVSRINFSKLKHFNDFNKGMYLYQNGMESGWSRALPPANVLPAPVDWNCYSNGSFYF